MKISVPDAWAHEAPARARFWPIVSAGPWSTLQSERLELVSRGDFASGLRACARRRASNPGEPRAGLLLLVHDAADDAHAADWAPIARWLEGSDRTVAVALDLPLHGPRTSAKLSERLVAAFAAMTRGALLDRNGAVLVEEFRTQSVHDLRRALDAMLHSGDVDASRIALVGVGLGAWVADAFLADETRVRAAVLVRTRRAPAAGPADPSSSKGAAGSTERLALDALDGQTEWADLARRFLDSRIGF